MATSDEQQTAKTVKELIIELGSKVDGVDEKVSRLEVLVRGNEEYGSKGLVVEVAELRLRVASLERFRDRAIWISIGMGFASGSGAWLLLQKIFGGG